MVKLVFLMNSQSTNQADKLNAKPGLFLLGAGIAKAT